MGDGDPLGLGVGRGGVGNALGVATGVGRGVGNGSPTLRPFRDSSGLRRERIVDGSAFAARGAGTC